jgi:TfoX/Sxy family transcriptional regulator of competence genes
MTYEVALAEAIREAISTRPDVTEKKMFGGLAFLVCGNMAIAASGQGGALVRVDPAESDHLVDTTNAEVAVMRGRPMTGWLRVPTEYLRTRRQISVWVRRGVTYAESLPPQTLTRQSSSNKGERSAPRPMRHPFAYRGFRTSANTMATHTAATIDANPRRYIWWTPRLVIVRVTRFRRRTPQQGGRWRR